MQYRVGDAVFNNAGQPGIVKDKLVSTGEVVVQPQSETLKVVQKRGYINGLSVEERKDYNEVMDKIRELDDPTKKVEELGTQIGQKRMGDAKSRLVAKYLDAQMQHIMLTNNIQNREYTVDEMKLGE